MSEPQHGTYAAAQWHNRHGVPKCGPCRKAVADYQKARRKSNPEKYAAEKARDYAHLAALWRLAQLHPKAFRALVADERRARGLS